LRLQILFLIVTIFTFCADAAVLRGIVVENRTGRPLSRTQVFLEPVQGTSTDEKFHTTTDGTGHFVFPNLTAGSFQVVARREHFVPARYGQRGWELPGTPVVLAADGEFSAELRMSRPGAINGEIRDPNGVGLPDYSVYAFLIESRIRMAASAQTDDRGQFRIGGLRPGRYLVGTAARALSNGESLLPTFFGQVTSALEARWVEVRLDEETPGADIQPLPGQLGAIRAWATGATRVSLVTDIGRAEGKPGPGSRFDFGGLAPGTYELLAEGGALGGPTSAWARVAVGGAITDVTLELGPSPTISVECTDVHRQPVPPQLVSIFLRRREEPESTAIRLNCGEQGVLTPGNWSFTTQVPTNFYLSGVDATPAEGAFEFQLYSKQARALALTLSSKPALLRGKVLASDGAPAIGAPVFLRSIEPDVAARVGPSRYWQADQKGEYRFDGLPPGRYEVISSFSLKIDRLAAWYPGLGRVIQLQEGRETALDLELTRLNP
jgi:hypothetical protein